MSEDSGLERIREAAVELFGRAGFGGTTVRAIAARAEVSPALIMHHFGSKDGLIRHCDDYVLGHIERLRDDYLRGGTTIDSVADYLGDHPELIAMTRYLGQALLIGGAASRRVFDRMIDAARNNLVTGIEAGRIRPVDDLEAYAAILASWNAASFMLGDAIAGRLGGASLLDPGVLERVKDAADDLRSRGILLPQKE